MRWPLALSLVVVCPLCVASCNSEPAIYRSNCTAAAANAESQKPPGGDARTAILPGGRALTPSGTLFDVGGFPLSIRVLPAAGARPADRYVVVSDGAREDEALRIVDLQAPGVSGPQHPVVSQSDYPIDAPGQPGLLYGMALTADGTRLYVSNGGSDPVDASQPIPNHYNTVEVYDLAGNPPQLVKNDALTLKLYAYVSTLRDGSLRIPSGIALSSDGKLLYVACQNDNTLAIVSLDAADYGTEIGRADLPGVGAYDVAVDEPSHTAFVSLWGGDSDSATIIDGVVPVDVSSPRAPVAAAAPIETGKAAEAELLLAGKLYVANADADTLSVVDAASRAVMTMPATASMILGATPNSVAADAERVYLANAGENAVVALDIHTLQIIGRIPTAWYPTAVATRSDGSLVIASARGMGRGPSDGSPEPPFSAGTLQLVPRPSDADLAAGDQVVAANLDRPRANTVTLNCPATGEKRFPLPVEDGNQSPIEHVFLVVRENKTYDSLFGDLDGGNGMANLVEFGEDNTPDAHDLARKFVLLDNFYSHAELSIQGHEWTTGCIANDYTEKAWMSSDTYGRPWRTQVPFGPASTLSRLALPGSDSIWIHLDKAGVAYHNYGEITNTAGAKTPADANYPGIYFNTSVHDVSKAQAVVENLNDPKFQLEPFTYISLPNDHTQGTSPGAPTPQSMIAENDEATGRLIDGLSRSKWWASSILFVVEDDPGGTLDHVEEHRSICLVASPWVKRGYRSSVNYDLGSVYRTIELLIHVAPLNLNDAHAAPMYDLFTTKPDFSLYTYVPRRIPETLNGQDAPLAEDSAKIDWSKPDEHDLTRILWKATHGRDAEPPGRFRYTGLLRDDD
jgi:YVTN family beta-propeller protein